MKKETIRWQGHGAEALESLLRHYLAQTSLDLKSPLPTTRALAERFAVANTTAYRVLLKLHAADLLWRTANGRFYPAGSRALLEKPSPFACLLRRLETWSMMYEGVMRGFSQVCGKSRRGMLFIHNESLVQHPDLAHPPTFAPSRLQENALKEFVRCHATSIDGILLDHAWSDPVLARFEKEFRNAVVVCRPTSLRFLSTVQTDFRQAALLALGHLLARGFKEVWLAVPFRNDTTVDLMIDNAIAASRELGLPLARRNIHVVATPAEQTRFIERLRRATHRVGVFCPEDNVTRILHKRLRSAGLPCPEKVGLLSGFGTASVRQRDISSIHCDFEAIGRQAAEVLNSGRRQHVVLPPRLQTGQTT